LSMYLVYKDTTKNTGRGQASTAIRFYLLFMVGSTLRHWATTFTIGFYPPSLVSALQCWAMPFIVWFYPPSLGYALCPTLRHWAMPFALHPTLCHWAMPFVIRFYPLSLGYILCCWVLPPSSIGLCLSSFGATPHCWAMPFTLPSIVGLCPLSFISTLHHWAMSFVIGFYHPLALGYAFCHLVLPHIIGLCPSPYPLLLGYALCHWVLPSVVGLCLSLLGSTLCHWAIPFIIESPLPMLNALCCCLVGAVGTVIEPWNGHHSCVGVGAGHSLCGVNCY